MHVPDNRFQDMVLLSTTAGAALALVASDATSVSWFLALHFKDKKGKKKIHSSRAVKRGRLHALGTGGSRRVKGWLSALGRKVESAKKSRRRGQGWLPSLCAKLPIAKRSRRSKVFLAALRQAVRRMSLLFGCLDRKRCLFCVHGLRPEKASLRRSQMMDFLCNEFIPLRAGEDYYFLFFSAHALARENGGILVAVHIAT